MSVSQCAAIGLVVLAGMVSHGRASAQAPDASNWRVGNDGIERVLAVNTRNHSLELQGVQASSGRNVWATASSPAPEYRFVVRDPETGAAHVLSSRDAHAEVSARPATGEGRVGLVVDFTRNDLPLAVRIEYERYPGHAFVRRRTTLTHRGDKPLLLEEVSVEQLPLDDPRSVHGRYGLERMPHDRLPLWFGMHTFDLAEQEEVAFSTGRSRAATWLALERSDRPQGLILGWETYEHAQCRVSRAEGVAVTTAPKLVLNPGDAFEAPASFVGLFEGDLDEGCFRTHRFVEEHIAWPNPDDDFPYLMFNSWGYGTAVYDALARQAIDLCEKLGVEVFVVDFGWEGPDWEPLPEAFPEGLAPLADLCRSRNIQFGIHFSYANVSEYARMYRDHPDWVYGQGAWAYGARLENHRVFALSLGLPEARAWITDKIVEVLDRDRVDWFLTDSLLWGHIDPEKHPVPGDQDYLATQAHGDVLAEVHKRRPKVLIEHCDGGLTLPSYRMMRQHVTSITCDNAQALDTRLSVYDLSYFLPPRYLDKYQQEWRSHYANRSCMFGGPWILMTPLHTLEPGSEDWDQLVADIDVYKRYRSRIRDGKVLHLLRPDDPKNQDWDGWDAIGSYHPGEDAAIVFAFRTRGPERTRVVPMKALRPDGRYVVKYLDTGKTYAASGAEIVRDGFRLELDAFEDDPKSQCSEIVVIEPAT